MLHLMRRADKEEDEDKIARCEVGLGCKWVRGDDARGAWGYSYISFSGSSK